MQEGILLGDAALDNLWTALAIALRGYSVRSDVVCNQIVDNAFRTALTTTSCMDELGL